MQTFQSRVVYNLHLQQSTFNKWRCCNNKCSSSERVLARRSVYCGPARRGGSDASRGFVDPNLIEE